VNPEFGAYELRKQIGKGGMAWVYLAVQRALDRPVAIKILFPHLAEDEKFVARFELEARAAAKMRHENIVQVYDYGKFEDQPYIAMEYVDGLNLREWLDTHGTPPIEVAMVMLRDLLRGLEHAHGRDIVHRDIKPSNVMLTPEGTVKLMDFGLARRTEDHTALTEHGAMLGTVPYMSTEQSLGQRVGKPSDIFSLGVVCYELLGGQRPFVGETQSAITDAILHNEPRSLAGLNPLVPDRLMAAIQHMLEKDAAKRCQDVAEVCQVLDELLVEHGIFQDRALLAEYARDPQQVGKRLAGGRLTRHLERGAALEKEGPEATARAVREYQCALHLDSGNKEARAALDRLAAAQAKLDEAQAKLAATAPAAQPGPAPAPAESQPKPAGAPAQPSALAPAAEVKSPAAATPAKPQTGPPAAPSTHAPGPSPAAKPKPSRPPPTQTQRIRLMLIAASVLLLMVVARIVYLALHRTSTTSTATLPPTSPAPIAPLVTPVDSPQIAVPPAEPESIPAVRRAMLTVATIPPGAVVSVDDTLKRDSTEAAVFADLLEGRHRVRAQKKGYLSKRQRVQVHAGRDTLVTLELEASPDSMASPSTQSGKQAAPPARNLVVETFPLGAMVRLDDGQENVSPARFKAVGTGHHTVRVTLEAYRSFETRVAFSAMRDSTLDVRLEPDAGVAYLLLRAHPVGDYFVDKVLRAANQEAAYIAVRPREHVVEMRNPRLFGKPTKNKVQLKAGEVKGLRADFTEGIGFIKVTTADGAQATLMIDGKAQPNPAPGIFPVKKGTHAVRLVREGRTTVEGLVTKTVAERETVTVSFTWE
jgi:serine/threonine-protein kinase